ncbi:Kelch-like protein 10 [Nymphon striatum]|nr:Kelch-like protein 10 [Nymphon striatum]
MVEELTTASNKVDFEINLSKTKVIFNKNVEMRPIMTGIVALDHVDRYTYLEQLISIHKDWESGSEAMCCSRCYVSVAVLGGFVYAVGGMECPNTLGTVEKYDPSSNQWNYVASMNFVKSSASVNVINGKLYVIGGIEVFEEDLCLNTVEMFDPVTNKWSNLPSMAVRRGHVASVSNQGGFNGHTVLRSVECYDICQNTWHSLSPMAIPRAGITVCFVENAYPTNEDRSSSTEDSN